MLTATSETSTTQGRHNASREDRHAGEVAATARVRAHPPGPRRLRPCAAQVDPRLFALTEHWASGGTAGDVPVGELLRRVLVDEPQAPLRLMYVTSQLDVTTVVGPRFYRPRAYQARDQLTIEVEPSAAGAGQVWLHTAGESAPW
jgi:hypothetical protein